MPQLSRYVKGLKQTSVQNIVFQRTVEMWD